MGIYVAKASALKELLEVHMPEANDFGNEIIPGAREMGYPVQVSKMTRGQKGGMHTRRGAAAVGAME